VSIMRLALSSMNLEAVVEQPLLEAPVQYGAQCVSDNMLLQVGVQGHCWGQKKGKRWVREGQKNGKERGEGWAKKKKKKERKGMGKEQARNSKETCKEQGRNGHRVGKEMRNGWEKGLRKGWARSKERIVKKLERNKEGMGKESGKGTRKEGATGETMGGTKGSKCLFVLASMCLLLSLQFSLSHYPSITPRFYDIHLG